MATVLITICIWLKGWHLIVRYHVIFVCSAMAVLFDVSSNIVLEILYICHSQAPNVPTVAAAMKKARDIVQYFNKSTEATKKLKDMQHESSLPK